MTSHPDSTDSDAPPAASTRVRTAPIAAIAGVVCLLAGEWILLVAGAKVHEMIAGGVAVLLSTIFLALVWRESTQRLQFTTRDLLECWRIPGYLCTDAWVLVRVLVLDLLGTAASSYYRVSGFRTAREQPLLVGRRVLATLYTTMSPNSIVVGVDWQQSRLLMHQLVRTPVTKMTRNLGGQP